MSRCFRYSPSGSIHRRAFSQHQKGFEQCQGILAAGQRDRDAIAVADHTESADRLANFAQENLFEVQNIIIRAARTAVEFRLRSKHAGSACDAVHSAFPSVLSAQGTVAVRRDIAPVQPEDQCLSEGTW